MLGRGGRRGGGRDRGRGDPISMVVRGLASGVGLVSESISAHKEKKREEKEKGKRSQETNTPSSAAAGDGIDNNRELEEVPPAYEVSIGPSTNAQNQYFDEKSANRPFYNADEKSSGNDERGGRSVSPELTARDELEGDIGLEDHWALDEAQDEISQDVSAKESATSAESSEDLFIQRHPPPANTVTPVGRLPMPVVIPQRRPKERSRGFIRAYAPVLQNCGIDQATWMEFLESFHRNSAASPWIDAVNLASFATLALPFGIGIAVQIAISQGVKVAKEVHGRERTNKYLYKVNENFFRPRGLYCLIMTWNPASLNHIENVDLTATIASRSGSGSTSLATKFRSSDGNTYGEMQFPETAPLVFPALDKLANQTGEEAQKKQGAVKRKMTFVADYWDRRATAEYAGKNPDSMLANVPQKKFSSRYADPNNPAASGSLIAFASGGHLVPQPGSRGLVDGLVSAVMAKGKQQAQLGSQSRYHDDQQYNIYGRNYRGGRSGYGQPRERLIPSPIGGVKKLLQQNVLYMMVVNMPTQDELMTAERLQVK